MIAETVWLAAEDLRFARPSAADFRATGDLRFPWGLPGFPNVRRFALSENPAMEPAIWLTGLGPQPPSLPLVDPWAWFPDYEPRLPAYAYAGLELAADEDALVLCVIVPAERGRPPSVNLAAPVVVNRRTRVGRQVMLENSGYASRTPFPRVAPPR